MLALADESQITTELPFTPYPITGPRIILAVLPPHEGQFLSRRVGGTESFSFGSDPRMLRNGQVR
jgi:hypothetical protein